MEWPKAKVKHGHAWRDYDTRFNGSNGTNAQGTGTLTITLIMVCKVQVLVKQLRSQGLYHRHMESYSGSRIQGVSRTSLVAELMTGA
ncbi:hypothetical protein P7K49_037785 [Saguinus oedipus]|uniref:Uncharacterized protein n=1 Tax=Saguinus oedipus TaxID=9490 RepID=A0ABQ9TJ08_SAGOE|nr:hypothetical protein P7K49_037785 [Saguinus oedipus]